MTSNSKDITCSDDLLVYDKKKLQDAFEKLKSEMKAAIHANKDVSSIQHYLICIATIYNVLEKIDWRKKGGIID